MPNASDSPPVIDLARHRAARRRTDAAKVLVIPSPIGFAFLNLPVQDCLPTFMADGFAAEERAGDV